MKNQILSIILFLFSIQSCLAQTNDPIWDIGTKWTYESFTGDGTVTWVTNDILDTLTINNKKLYEVASFPYFTGIRYFYYEDGKVYNYQVFEDHASLLYDFNIEENYSTEYFPLCDPYFEPTAPPFYKTYGILMDTITDYEMPDGTIRTMQHITTQDTANDNGYIFLINEFERQILNGVGFMDGAIHNSHDWEFGMYICDDFENFTGQLRCYGDNEVSYNFVGYACDSTWVITSTNPPKEKLEISLYPNPTSELVQIKGIDKEVAYEIFAIDGGNISRGITENKTIRLMQSGMNLIRIKLENKWIMLKAQKLE